MCKTEHRFADGLATVQGMENEERSGRRRTLRHLRELVVALDTRVPHVHNPGEINIARDAAALKNKALRRISALENESGADLVGLEECGVAANRKRDR